MAAHEGSIHTGSSQRSGGLSVSHGSGEDGGHPSASGSSSHGSIHSGKSGFSIQGLDGDLGLFDSQPMPSLSRSKP